MRRKTVVSVIVSTYNCPKTLSLCLRNPVIHAQLSEEIVIMNNEFSEETRQSDVYDVNSAILFEYRIFKIDH